MIRSFSLSECDFSRDSDKRRSFSAFSSAVRSLRRFLMESSALVYLKVCEHGESESIVEKQTWWPQKYHQISFSALMVLLEASKNLLDDKI